MGGQEAGVRRAPGARTLVMGTSGRRGSGKGSSPTVMLVDDHPLWRETLRKVVERQQAGRVVAEAGDGESAVAAVVDARPEVVVMDVDLPGIDGIATTRQVVAALPEVKILFLSAFDDRSKVLGAVEAGASGYLLKTAGPREIADAIGRVAAGELVFPPHLAEVLLGELRARGRVVDVAAQRSAPAATPDPIPAVFRQQGDFWTLEFGGHVAHLAALKGLHHLVQLLATPGREVLAAELMAVATGTGDAARGAGARVQDGLHVGVSTGVGAALDATAKRAYRERIEELRAEVDEADQFGDVERAGQARTELQLLTEELIRAVGIGGRDRPVRSDVERARIAVTRRIRRAIQRIMEVHPELGRHLDRAVRTGTYCSYDPETPIEWTLT